MERDPRDGFEVQRVPPSESDIVKETTKIELSRHEVVFAAKQLAIAMEDLQPPSQRAIDAQNTADYNRAIDYLEVEFKPTLQARKGKTEQHKRLHTMRVAEGVWDENQEAEVGLKRAIDHDEDEESLSTAEKVKRWANMLKTPQRRDLHGIPELSPSNMKREMNSKTLGRSSTSKTLRTMENQHETNGNDGMYKQQQKRPERVSEPVREWKQRAGLTTEDEHEDKEVEEGFGSCKTHTRKTFTRLRPKGDGDEDAEPLVFLL